MPRHLAAAIVCVACGGLLAPAGEARAQCDYGLTIHQSADLDGSGHVGALAIYEDASGPAIVVAGGDLFEVPGQSSTQTYNVAKWNLATGWTPLGEPNELYGAEDLEVFQGQIFVMHNNSVYRWTGSTWEVVGEALIGGGVELVVFDDASGTGPALIAATRTFTVPFESRLYKLHDSAWQQVAQFTQSVVAVEVFEGTLVVAGSITAVNGMPVNRIAAWDGQRWIDLGAGIGGSFTDLVTHEIDGEAVLVACGSITLDGTKPLDVACWDGEAWSALPEIDVDNQYGIGPLGMWDNGDGDGPAICIAVTIESPSSGDRHDRLYRLDPSTRQWEFLGGTFYLPNSVITCMVEFPEGASEFPTLFVGGKFVRFSSVQSYHLVRLLPRPHGAIEPLPSDPQSLRGDIMALAEHSDGGRARVFAGGSFRGLTQGTSIHSLIARYDGESWTSIGDGSGVVRTLKSLDDGSGPALFAGGTFSNLTPSVGQAPSHIARWDGVNWVRMGSLPSSVHDICMHDDGTGATLYATLSNDTVMKWHAATSTWADIAMGFTAGGTSGPSVDALVSFDDGSGPALYVGGWFDSVSGVSAANIARWRGAAIGWQPVGAGRPGAVHLLHIHNDGVRSRLIAEAGDVAQWTGSEWAAVGDAAAIGFHPGNGGAIATFDDGGGPALIVSTYNRMARWNGQSWAYLPDYGADALLADGDVMYVGSPFAIWAPAGDPLAIESVIGGGAFDLGVSPTLHVNVVHGGTVNYQWRHDGMPLSEGVGSYSGVQSSTARIWNIQGSHEGVYDVVVTNDCTSVTSEAIVIDVIGSCVGDITIDNAVQGDDIVALVTAWGACPISCPSDLTHDDAVDIDDLLLLTSRWGDCP